MRLWDIRAILMRLRDLAAIPMRLRALGWCVAVTMLCVPRLSLGQSNAKSAVPAPALLSSTQAVPIPVCQWGACAAVCDQVCPVGSVCGVGGACVDVVDRAEIAQTIQDEKADKLDAMRSARSRKRARYWPRYSLGGGIGGVSLIDRKEKAGEFLAHLGLRKQLDDFVGLHAQLIGALGLRYERDDAGQSHALTLAEVDASVTPYFGPFQRFYLGPSLLVGYRWYSDSFKQWFASTTQVQNHLVREGGLRAGILAGSEEQLDITALVTSSFDGDTPWRFMFGFAYELR
ncbi:MAG TPA: hypothetical protein VIV60_12545 [Polyangiaceae bacterium]